MPNKWKNAIFQALLMLGICICVNSQSKCTDISSIGIQNDVCKTLSSTKQLNLEKTPADIPEFDVCHSTNEYWISDKHAIILFSRRQTQAFRIFVVRRSTVAYILLLLHDNKRQICPYVTLAEYSKSVQIIINGISSQASVSTGQA